MPTGRPSAGARSILVVDDDDAIREVATVALQLIGHWSVHTAHSGTEAFRMARELQPDVMLLDVMMPSVDGPSTVALLRSDPRTRDLPVIFLTAKSPQHDPGQADVAGVITKPFDPLTLSQDITRLLGWPQ